MKRNTFYVIYRLIALVGRFIWIILLASFSGVLGYLLAINVTLFAGLAILKYLGVAINISYQVLFSIIIISGILRGIVRYFEQYGNHYMAFKLLQIVRVKIFKALRKQNVVKLEEKNKGDLVSLLQGDIETLEVFYAHTITPFLIAFITSLIMVIVISLLSSIYLGLIALGTYLIIGLLIPLIFYKFNKNSGRSYRKKLSQFEEFYLDSIYGGYEIISQNNNDVFINDVKNKTKELIKLNKDLDNKNTIFTNIMNLLIVLLNLIIIFVGYILYQRGIIDSYYIIIAYVVLTSSFGPVLALANLPNNLSQTFASANRVLDIIDVKPVIKDGNKELDYSSLTIKDAYFNYGNKAILKGVNLEIKQNEIIGIYGPSGIGKSTILKLIMHFYELDKGSILLNDEDIKEYSLNSLYKNINLFSQTTYLFQDTIKNNLLIAKKDATMEELVEACKNASIYDYIMSLKDGFDTKISDLKNNISEGEKQRLGLARVFLRNPKLLLLDEATSNIDAINEGIILKSLKKYKEKMAIIIISHRKSTLNICDNIYELKEGKLCLV